MKEQKYYWQNINRYCDYFITEDNTVLELQDVESPELEQAIKDEKVFDVIVLKFAVGKTLDLQSFLEKLHILCHQHTRIHVVYYNFIWEPLIRFAEWIRIKKKTGITNWLSGNDLKNFLYLAN
jgi:hypothetical protein